MHPNTAAALKAGRARWLQRMRIAKQAGLIERFPNGRRARDASKLHPDRTIQRAQKIIEVLMAKNASLRAVPDDPGLDDIAPEPRAAPLEQSTAVREPQAGADGPSAQAAPESPDEAAELLEQLLAALLDAPSPFDEADEGPSLWSVVADALPDSLYGQLDRWLEQRWL
jgi:hypothetical protein